MHRHQRKRMRIAFFGHFDSTNFGNESTLQGILYHLRCFRPDAEITCISTGPKATSVTHHIEAIPISKIFIKTWAPRTPLMKMLRKVFIGLPSEAYRWIKGINQLWQTEMLIIPGTGLLTDAYGLLNWGPYNLLRWSLIAKLCRCKLLFVSIGAGPLYGTLARRFARLSLSLADFRSYRDNSTLEYLRSIGFRTHHDRVYPDLAFSLPEEVIPRQPIKHDRRAVVGLGVMEYAGKYSVANPTDAVYLTYLDNLVIFVRWLLANEYDVRFLLGDLADMRARREFRDLLRERLPALDETRIIDEPIGSVQELLQQIAATDTVVVTRFHNVLLALLCERPVISISFHHKCESLMNAMGLSEYCLDINDLKADKLIEKFCDLQMNANKIKPLIKEKVKGYREALDEQYQLIFNQ